MTREVASTALPGDPTLERQAPRDDAALRRSLAAMLGPDDQTLTQAAGPTTSPPAEPAEGALGSTGHSAEAGGSRAATAAIVTLLVLGSFLLLAGLVLLVDDLSGRHAFDEARLASLWPAGLLVAGALSLANAFALYGLGAASRRVHQPRDSAGTAAAASSAYPVSAAASGAPPVSAAASGASPVSAAASGTSSVSAAGSGLAPSSAAASGLAPSSAAASGAAPDIADASLPTQRGIPGEESRHTSVWGTPGPSMASAGESLSMPPRPGPRITPDDHRNERDRPSLGRTPRDRTSPDPTSPDRGALRPAPDALAALLELQALRRNRLISKKQYRAKRRALVAGLAPRFAAPTWPGDDADMTGGGPSGRPLAYWGPTAE